VGNKMQISLTGLSCRTDWKLSSLFPQGRLKEEG